MFQNMNNSISKMGQKRIVRRRGYRKQTVIESKSGSQNQQSLFSEMKMTRELMNKYNDIIGKKFQHLVMNRFKSSVGSYFPVQYRPEYNFEQNWELKAESPVDDKLLWCFKESSPTYIFLNFILMLVSIVLIWYTSVRRVFDCYLLDELYIVLSIISASELALLGLKSIKKRIASNICSLDLLPILNKGFIVLYGTMVYLRCLDKQAFTVAFDVVFVALIYHSAAKLYTAFRRILISSRYKNQMNIFDLIIKMLIVGHIFAILLYITVLINPTPRQNWTSKVPEPLDTWQSRYIYSLYFAFSTMLTVGYGDLSPVNSLEILVNIVVQIVGVAFFGYVVSEIGVNLSSIRKCEEELEHNIGMIEHLSQYYDLDKDVTIKVRDYLVANNQAQQKFNTEDQDKFLSKLSQDLRQDITNETNTKLIRKSLFFVCGWTKNFRNQLAKCLMKKMFSPNEYLMDNSHIYIIQKGEVGIFVERKCRGRSCLKKEVKSIVSQADAEILTNVFGYSRALTQRSIPLVGLAKNCVVSYILERKSFDQVVKQDSNDFQYLMELKHKMLLLKKPELMEVPELINTRSHYKVLLYYLILKCQKQQKLATNVAPRTKYQRSNRKLDLVLGEEEQIGATLTRKLTSKTFAAQVSQVTQELQTLFEVEREFRNYFRKNNLSYIIQKMQNNKT